MVILKYTIGHFIVSAMFLYMYVIVSLDTDVLKRQWRDTSRIVCNDFPADKYHEPLCLSWVINKSSNSSLATNI